MLMSRCLVVVYCCRVLFFSFFSFCFCWPCSVSRKRTTIESDPGVFTELIEKIGVKGLQVEELYNLDVEDLKRISPVYGLIFLFKWDPSTKSRAPVAQNSDHIYFMKQVITNACATQAITSILLNSADIELGEMLRDFKAFTADFPADMKGLALSNCEAVRTAHNSFARPEPFVTTSERAATKDDDVFHFVSFLPIAGRLYELDGLAAGPIDHGACTDVDWVEKIVPVIEQRIALYSSKEIKFNLMAVIKNRLLTLEQRLAALDSINDHALREMQRVDITEQITQEKDRRQRWREENVRRRHNYIPFVVSLLGILADKGHLPRLIDDAKRKQAARTERDKKRDRETAEKK